MIPFFRSIHELMIITQPKVLSNPMQEKTISEVSEEDSAQAKRYIRSLKEKKVILPSLPKLKYNKWIKRKEIVSKFFEKLDYNNQIQSSYDLTLLENQNNYDHYDAA